MSIPFFLYQIMPNSKKIYGLIGKNLAHSFSKKYFTDKFEIQSVNADYLNFELRNIEAFEFLSERYEIQGLNVTIPYKEKIIPFLDELTPEAKLIGAVNTIQYINGRTVGHNTDVFGFKQMIKPFFKGHHERAMILGTGGASKAVAHVLEEIGAEVIFISRNPTWENEFSYGEINENMIKFCGIIVNTSPVGMFPSISDVVKIPYEYLGAKHLVIDLIYNPKETVFLRNAKMQGAITLNGETMLVQQAEKAWEIWNL